jgi:hypothetical protein
VTVLLWIIGAPFALVFACVVVFSGLVFRNRRALRRADSVQPPVVETQAQRRWRKSLIAERGLDPEVTQVLPGITDV